jgi:hypothetical protein
MMTISMDAFVVFYFAPHVLQRFHRHLGCTCHVGGTSGLEVEQRFVELVERELELVGQGLELEQRFVELAEQELELVEQGLELEQRFVELVEQELELVG